MSVTYDPKLGSQQQFEDIEFYDKEAVARFHSFRRGDDGRILVLEKKTFDYYQDAGGQWFLKGEGDNGPTAVSPDEVEYQDMIYWGFQIVSPLEFAGKTLPFRGTLHGRRQKSIVVKCIDGKWHFNLPRRSLGLDDAKFKVGLYVVAEKCGLDLAALDTESAMYDSDYVVDGLAALNQIVQSGMPLTVVDVLEHIVEKKLQEAAARGLLVKVKTGEKRPGAMSPWIGYGSIAPLTAEQAARFQAAASAGQDEAAPLRDKVRGMIPAEGVARQEFLRKVYTEASAIHSGLPEQDMLAPLNASELTLLVSKLEGTGEMTL